MNHETIGVIAAIQPSIADKKRAPPFGGARICIDATTIVAENGVDF
jgi:hypothetical protein